MLKLENISVIYGGRKLFDRIDLLINPGERVGLVGPNGAGKTTLLRVIAGEIAADEGTIQISNNETVGYLPQDGVQPDPGNSVYEEVETAFDELLHLREEVSRAQDAIASEETGSDAYEKAMRRYGTLQERLERSGAYSLKAEIEKVLMGLGFSTEDFDRSTTEFSGGWLMRIALAKLLLKNPTYLLLDEPTNHLDIETLRWIEKFLSNYEGAVVIVSHDRAFLDSVTERTLALEQGNIDDYAGNYTYYREKREEQLEHLRQARKNQQRQIKQTREFIERFRYKASKAKQVQSRIKQLEKMEEIEVEESREEISFDFNRAERSGAVVLELKQVKKNYGDNTVFENLNYRVERGDKIAVVGPNGAGKSTLIRIMAGREPIDGGSRETGHNVTVSYFAQHQADELDLSKTLLETMREADPKASETRLRTILGCFLFQGDDVFKKVSVLSGGEKSRLALARMLLSPANFMLFDEPTNHLDMQSKEILQQALDQFEGSFMIVSHDRDFLDPIVNKTLEVQPDKLKTYLGDVSYYMDNREWDDTLQPSASDGSGDAAGETEEEPLSRKEIRRKEAEQRKRKYETLRPLNDRLKSLEQQIEELEKRKQQIEARMNDAEFYEDSDSVSETAIEYDRVRKELEKAESTWEDLMTEIMEIEEQFSGTD